MFYVYDIIGKKLDGRVEMSKYGPDVHGIRQMIIYGLKGMATYAQHARLLADEWDYSIGKFTFEVRHYLTCFTTCKVTVWSQTQVLNLHTTGNMTLMHILSH